MSEAIVLPVCPNGCPSVDSAEGPARQGEVLSPIVRCWKCGADVVDGKSLSIPIVPISPYDLDLP